MANIPESVGVAEALAGEGRTGCELDDVARLGVIKRGLQVTTARHAEYDTAHIWRGRCRGVQEDLR